MHGTQIYYLFYLQRMYSTYLSYTIGYYIMFDNITYQLFRINYIVIFAFTYKVGNNLIMNHVLQTKLLYSDVY